MMASPQNLVIGWLVVMVAIVWFIGAHSEPPPICLDEETREKARKIMLDGIDEALKNHTVHMFEVWMKDPSNQPERAVTGMRQGINAYKGALKEAQRWNPPPCPSKP